MIYRFMYTAYCKDNHVVDMHHPAVRYLCLNEYQGQLFLYIEAVTPEIDPTAVIGASLIPFPDGSLWFRMIDVFHYSKPLSEEHWKRRTPNKTPWVRINYLKPEKTASYVFYHYQFQEENPGVFDKYGILYLYGNLLVHYLENPTEEETETYEGALSSHNTPVGKEAWDDMIERHFIPWDDPAIQNDPDGPWLAIKTLFFREY